MATDMSIDQTEVRQRLGVHASAGDVLSNHRAVTLCERDNHIDLLLAGTPAHMVSLTTSEALTISRQLRTLVRRLRERHT